MALITCPECGKEVSSDAKNCPNCGKKLKKSAFPYVRFGISILTSVWALVLFVPVFLFPYDDWHFKFHTAYGFVIAIEVISLIAMLLQGINYFKPNRILNIICIILCIIAILLFFYITIVFTTETTLLAPIILGAAILTLTIGVQFYKQ